MLPWEAKAAQLAAASIQQSQQSQQDQNSTTPRSYLNVDYKGEFDSDPQLKKVIMRISYLWKLSALTGISMLASSISLFCSRISPYNQIIPFLLPAVIGSLLTPLWGRLLWLPAAIHGIGANRPMLIFLFFVSISAQLVHLILAAVGLPLSGGGGGGLVGAGRAFAGRRWTAVMISGVSAMLCLLVGVCQAVVAGEAIRYLRQ